MIRLFCCSANPHRRFNNSGGKAADQVSVSLQRATLGRNYLGMRIHKRVRQHVVPSERGAVAKRLQAPGLVSLKSESG